MSYAIKIDDKEQVINIINNEDVFELDTNSDIKTVVNNEDVFEVDDAVRERIIINATDVRFVPLANNDLLMACSSIEQVGDLVYLFADGEVRRADNSDISTAKVVGFIVSKPDVTSCEVRIYGTINIASLSVGNEYFLGSSGSLINSPPVSTGSVIVRVGQAIESAKLLININNNYIIRNG